MSAATDSNDRQEWLRLGRKASYSEQKAAQFCRYIAMGYSLKKACSQEGMPAITQVYEWRRKYPSFETMYREAQEDRGMTLGDKIGDVAEGVLAGEIDPNAGRVAIDAYKFTAARLASRTWGEKSQVTVEHSVSSQAAQVLLELSQRPRRNQAEQQIIDVTPEHVLEKDRGSEQDQ